MQVGYSSPSQSGIIDDLHLSVADVSNNTDSGNLFCINKYSIFPLMLLYVAYMLLLEYLFSMQSVVVANVMDVVIK